MALIPREEMSATPLVVIGNRWFALIDGELVVGDVNKYNEVILDPQPVAEVLRNPGALPGVRALQADARCAELMLQAVARPVIDPDATLPGALNPNALRDAAIFGEALARLGGRESRGFDLIDHSGRVTPAGC
jgi:hypothetical protein